MQSSNAKSDLDLWPQINRSAPQVTRASSTIIVRQTTIEVLWGNVQSSKSEFDLDLLTPKSRGPPHEQLVWSFIFVSKKKIEFSCRKGTKFKVWIWLWPFDPKINKGSPWVMVNTCIKYHNFLSKGDGVIERKRCKFKLQIWPWPFDPKINRVFLQWAIHTCVNYHHCMSKGNGVMWKPLFHRQTDGQTQPSWWNQLTSPATSFAGFITR